MHEISIKAEELFHTIPLSITNSLLTTFVVLALMMGAVVFAKRKFSLVPTKFQSLLELPIEAFYKMSKQMSPKHFAEFFPIVTTIFLFVLISNWFALIPGLNGIGLKHIGADNHESVIPLFRGPTADLNTTVALAIIAVVSTHYFGLKHLGVKIHLSKFINFSNPINFFVGLLELVSEISKVISFSFRLFGNIFAGEVLLIVMGSLVPILLPIPFLGLEIFVGVIQALVFAMLTLVFSSMAVAKHG